MYGICTQSIRHKTQQNLALTGDPPPHRVRTALHPPSVACPRRARSYIFLMRTALALLFLASPAAAWEFRASPICTLTDTSDAGEMTVTYDPAITEYAITVTLPDGIWPNGATFAMAFVGDRPINIQTDRFTRSDDGRSLTVIDRGFGNVLNGLEFNNRAYAIMGETAMGVPLDGIGPAIAAFRDCPAVNLT